MCCLALFGVWAYFDDFQKRKCLLQETVRPHKLQYNSLMGFFINSLGKCGLNFRCFGSFDFWDHLKSSITN